MCSTFGLFTGINLCILLLFGCVLHQPGGSKTFVFIDLFPTPIWKCSHIQPNKRIKFLRNLKQMSQSHICETSEACLNVTRYWQDWRISNIVLQQQHEHLRRSSLLLWNHRNTWLTLSFSSANPSRAVSLRTRERDGERQRERREGRWRTWIFWFLHKYCNFT